jgi:transcriptional regulator with XRE-family HTH domain
MTSEEDAEAVRRGYWLRRARDNAGITLSDAAVTAGLSAGSGSTVSLWERGQRPIKVHQMKRLALRYGVPVTLFTDPPMTDDERLREAIAEATRLALADSSASGPGPALRVGDGPGSLRRRRQA